MTDVQPAKFNARAVLDQTINAALLEFVSARGRRPLPAEYTSLRRGAAQKILDRVGEWGDPGDRSELEAIAAAALGGVFEEER